MDAMNIIVTMLAASRSQRWGELFEGLKNGDPVARVTVVCVVVIGVGITVWKKKKEAKQRQNQSNQG